MQENHTWHVEPHSPRQSPSRQNNLRPVLPPLVVPLETRRCPVRDDETQHRTETDKFSSLAMTSTVRNALHSHSQKRIIEGQIRYSFRNDQGDHRRPRAEKEEDVPAPEEGGGKQRLDERRGDAALIEVIMV